MAIKKYEVFLCDKCGSECKPEDSYKTKSYEYFHGIGYSKVKVGFSWEVPYVVSNGSLCQSCVDDVILDLANTVIRDRERRLKDA